MLMNSNNWVLFSDKSDNIFQNQRAFEYIAANEIIFRCA